MSKQTVISIILFLSISLFVLSGIIINDKLIGRSIDFPVPPESYLVKNVYLSNFYQWWGQTNGGSRNTFSATLIPINSILYLPLLFGAGSWFISRFQIVLSIFLSMLFFYLFPRRLIENYKINENSKTFISCLGSIFFTLNSYFFCEIIFGSNVMYATFSFVPLLLFATLSYYRTDRKSLYFFISLISLTIISSTLQHLVLAYFFLVIMVIVYKDLRLFIKLGLCHFALSFYWFMPLLYHSSAIRVTEQGIARGYSINLTISASKFLDALINKEYFFNRNTYLLALNNDILSLIWILNAYLLFALSLICLFKINNFQRIHKKLILGMSIILLLSILMIKGAHEPFGALVLFLYKNIPFFDIYRSLQHYIGFYVLSISVLFVFSCVYLINKNNRLIIFLALFVFINAMPWWLTKDLGTENITKANIIPSYFGQYYLTEGNNKMYSLNKLPLDFAIMHIPPGFSINFLAVGKNKFNYITQGNKDIKNQGGDTGLNYGNKKYYATDRIPNVLASVFDNLEKAMYTDGNFINKYKNLFSFLNVRYFVLREDVKPLYSKNASLFNIQNIRDAIGKSNIFSSTETTDYITIMKNNYFLPHFYTPKAVIRTNQALESLPELLSKPDFQIRSVVYFENQSKNNEFIDKNATRHIYLFNKEYNGESSSLDISKDQLDSRKFDLLYALRPNTEIILNYSKDKNKAIFGIELSADNIIINNNNFNKRFYPIYELECNIGDLIRIGPVLRFSVKAELYEKIQLQELLNDIKIISAKSSKNTSGASPVKIQPENLNDLLVQEDVLIKEKNTVKYVINQKQNENLIHDNSFEKGLWGDKVLDCTDDKNYDPKLSMQLSPDAKDGKYSLELASAEHIACTSRTFIVKLDQGKIYKYSFDYKNVEGGQMQYFYSLSGNNKNYPFSETINTKNHNWNHFETLIEAEDDIDSIQLFFYAPVSAAKTVNRYDNISLVEWTSGELLNYYLTSRNPKEIKTPNLEYKKINPVKYRIIAHGVTDVFPLIFSESFNEGWKLYIAKSEIRNPKSEINSNNQLLNYKILDGNEGDQATKEEVADFMSKGWITTLGDGKERQIAHQKYASGKESLDYIEKYRIDFISKNFQDTIQNDNLPKGNFYETWLARSSKLNNFMNFPLYNSGVMQLDDANHLIANGYANSWIVNPNEVCKAESSKVIKPGENNGFCVKNPDGSYDMELVVEFGPQRLFYIGLIISGMVLFCCILFSSYSFYRDKKKDISNDFFRMERLILK